MKKQIKLMWAVSMVLLCVTSAAQSAPVAAPANTAQSSLISLNFTDADIEGLLRRWERRLVKIFWWTRV